MLRMFFFFLARQLGCLSGFEFGGWVVTKRAVPVPVSVGKDPKGDGRRRERELEGRRKEFGRDGGRVDD